MAKKKPGEATELQQLHEWIGAVGGNISLGDSILKSVETSKSGDKLTIVLKKGKPEKNPVRDIPVLDD